MSRRPPVLRLQPRSTPSRSALALLLGCLWLCLCLCLSLGCAGAKNDASDEPQAEGESQASIQQEDRIVIEEGTLVGIEYTLTLQDGTAIDSNVGGEALRFQQGSGQIIPGLDRELVGMAVGESKSVTVAPEDGYGPLDPSAYADVPVSELPEDARVPGTALMAEDAEGRTQRLRVHKVDGETATLDFNHPLAGETLVFEVKILEIQ